MHKCKDSHWLRVSNRDCTNELYSVRSIPLELLFFAFFYEGKTNALLRHSNTATLFLIGCPYAGSCIANHAACRMNAPYALHSSSCNTPLSRHRGELSSQTLISSCHRRQTVDPIESMQIITVLSLYFGSSWEMPSPKVDRHVCSNHHAIELRLFVSQYTLWLKIITELSFFPTIDTLLGDAVIQVPLHILFCFFCSGGCIPHN